MSVSIIKTTQNKITVTWKGEIFDNEGNLAAVMTAKFSSAYPNGMFVLQQTNNDADVEEEYEQFKSDFFAYIEDMEPLVTESEAVDD